MLLAKTRIRDMILSTRTALRPKKISAGTSDQKEIGDNVLTSFDGCHGMVCVLYKRKTRLDEMNDEVTQHRVNGLEEDDKENKRGDARSEVHSLDTQSL